MIKFKKPFIKLVKTTMTPFRKLKLLFKNMMGLLDVPVIYPYMGFGNANYIYVSGIVTEYKGLTKPKINQSRLKNLLSMLKRYMGDQMEGVKVKVKFMSLEKVITTNALGIFHCHIEIKNKSNLTNKLWYDIEFELLEDIIEEQGSITAKGQVLILENNPGYGIISDVDDTFLISHSTNAIKKMRLMLFKNAITRMPFEGVGAFFRALEKGMNEHESNPFFYVSSSEWNLYDLLVDFCDFHSIPKGPFLLQEKKVNILKFWKSGGGKHNHKLVKIRTLLNLYKSLNFILIGDSGQKDAEIYITIAKEFPGRIKVIYIRNVSSLKREKEIKQNTKNTLNGQTELILVKNTEDAAKDAIERGLIHSNELPSISIHTEKDRRSKQKAKE